MTDRKKDLSRLCDIISDYSEESYCAGWLHGIEFDFLMWLDNYRANKHDTSKKFGLDLVPSMEMMAEVDAIQGRLGTWVLWKDDVPKELVCRYTLENMPADGDRDCGPVEVQVQEARDAADAERRKYTDLMSKWDSEPDNIQFD